MTGNLRNITSPQTGHAIRPIMRTITVGDEIITEAHYICPTSGIFVTKVEISREKIQPINESVLEEMLYEDEGVSTKEFFDKISSFVHLMTKRLTGTPEELYTIVSVIRNAMGEFKSTIEVPSDDTAFNKTYKPIRVNLPISDVEFKLGKVGPRVAVEPTLEAFKDTLMNALNQISQRDDDGDLVPIKPIYSEQVKTLYRILDLTEDAIESIQGR